MNNSYSELFYLNCQDHLLGKNSTLPCSLILSFDLPSLSLCFHFFLFLCAIFAFLLYFYFFLPCYCKQSTNTLKERKYLKLNPQTQDCILSIVDT